MKHLLLVLLMTLVGCGGSDGDATPGADSALGDVTQEETSESDAQAGIDVADSDLGGGESDSQAGGDAESETDSADCPEGTTGTPGDCIDTNECDVDASGMNVCGDPTYTQCTNLEAAPPICEDIDECLTDNGGCGDPELVHCVNQQAAPPSCQPVEELPDECDAQDDAACGVNASCVGAGPGPAQCACDEGFTGDGWICAPSAKLGCTNPKAANYAPWATESSGDCIFPVTFTVDLNGSGFSPSAPAYVQGGFNDWCGYCMPLSDPDGDGIWTQTYYLGPGNHEYLFSQNGWDNPESLVVGGSCDATPTDQYPNRGFTVTDSGLTLNRACFGSCTCADDKGTPVTFMVDLGCDEEPSNASTSVRVSGSFCDWCEDGYELADPDGDGRWMNTFILQGDSIDYLYQRDSNSQETLLDDLAAGAPDSCAPSSDGSTFAYRQLALGEEHLAMDTFGQCEACGSNLEPQPWVLQWSDEFDGEDLDPGAWTPQLGDGSQYGIPGWGNGELQSYKAENAIVADGHLTIRAKQESADGKAYTSARIRTTATFSSGRIEARVKQPAGKGLWPAFWMLPEGGDWPMDGEIDIMEFRGEHTHETLGTIHYGDAWNNKGSSGNTLATEEDLSEDFHIYAIEWRPGSIQWFFDDQLFHSAMPMQAAPFTWPFDSGSFYILLNLAVGGNFVEAPDANTPFPSDLVIDYVRVFSEQPATP